MYEKTYKANVLKQSSSPKMKRGFIWKKFLLAIIVLGIFFGIGYMLRHSKFQITNVDVLGTNVLDEQNISESVESQLVGVLLWIFPRTSVLLVNDKKIERNLKKQFSRIETVVAKRTNLHSIEITIKEFEALYLWCTLALPALPAQAGQVGDDCYFMDKQGVVYNQAPVFSGTAYPKVFTGAPLEELPFQGIRLIDLEQVATLQQRLSEINITPVTFRSISPRELQVDFLHNKSTAKLLLDPTVPTETSLEYLFSGIRTEPLSGLFNNESKKLLYIDVRFSNKVVYKFDQSELSAQVGETE